MIFKDRELRRTLAALLGRADALGPLPFDTFGPTTVEVAVRDKVVEPADYLRLTLSPEPRAAKIDGELRIEKADDPTRKDPQFIPLGEPLQVRYEGPLAASLGLLVEVPGEPGGYRLAYYDRGEPAPVGSDGFFVQQRAP